MQYYQYFCQVNPQNFEDYNKTRNHMVQNYFESLMFTLQYYLTGCPCFEWSYQYRVSPIPSDMFHSLNKKGFNLNTITFMNKKPFTPFQQLMMILPPQMSSLLPMSISQIMFEPSTKKMYPTKFKVDVLAGIKYIYSEAILPELEVESLIQKIQQREKELLPEEKKRNEIHDRLLMSKKK
jgi:5'-3' exonuclease